MGFLQWPKPLKDLPRFCDLSERGMEEVCERGREVTVPKGWAFIGEKTPADTAYLLLKGRAAVLVQGEQVAELGPGDIVGEVGLRHNRLRTATVFALDPLTLLAFTQPEFDDLYDRIPAFKDAVDSAIAERVGQATSSQ